MTAPLIGLIGRKRSGKDTLARTLIEECGYARFAFADPLKRALLRVDPLIEVPVRLAPGLEPDFYIYRLGEFVAERGWEAAKEVPEVRRLLQEYGVTIRQIDPDFWVRATLKRVSLARAQGVPVVVTDVRFPNEAEAIAEAGGILVRVTRPGLDQSDTHISETALDDYPADVTVRNDGSLEDLAAQARLL